MALTLAEDACCVDVGANIGAVLRRHGRASRRAAGTSPSSRCPSSPRSSQREFPGVDVRNAAVSDHAGEATFHRVSGRETRSSLSTLDSPPDELEPFTVALEDLDSALPRISCPR